MNPGKDMSWGPASSPTLRAPEPSVFSTSRRVGSASAANTRSRSFRLTMELSLIP